MHTYIPIYIYTVNLLSMCSSQLIKWDAASPPLQGGSNWSSVLRLKRVEESLRVARDSHGVSV